MFLFSQTWSVATFPSTAPRGAVNRLDTARGESASLKRSAYPINNAPEKGSDS